MKITKRTISIFIKESTAEDGKVRSTVGLRFENADGIFEGDYEAFETAALTDEQIACSVKRLVEKMLPGIPKAEEKPCDAIIIGGTAESCGRFVRQNGKFVRAQEEK